jgi:hypothetical protein
MIEEEKKEDNNNNILDKEIESWKNFKYALREENRILFNKMLSGCQAEEYTKAVNSKGENYSIESLFRALILQQQKMINQLIATLSSE